ncbi:cytochrome c biogenesis protein CcdA [Lentzea sp. CA-135723]|uniref:cytochrome c biogenesis protein CcdA n=1 Tax=Lentzea sp. CA-135723 TaxID=3239950 RepID=UPI003D8FB175
MARTCFVTAHCLGPGLPFVLLAVSARWAVTTAGWLKRHTRAVQLAGGVLLLAVGALLVTGLWGEVIIWLRGPISGFSTPL